MTLRKTFLVSMLIGLLFTFTNLGADAQPVPTPSVPPKLDGEIKKSTTTKYIDSTSKNDVEKTVEPMETKGVEKTQKTTLVEKDKDGDIVKIIEKVEKIKAGVPTESGTVEETTKTYKKGEKDPKKPNGIFKKVSEWSHVPSADHWTQENESYENEKFNDDPRYTTKKVKQKLIIEKGKIVEGWKKVTVFTGPDDKGTTTEEVYDPKLKKFVPKPANDDGGNKKNDKKPDAPKKN